MQRKLGVFSGIKTGNLGLPVLASGGAAQPPAKPTGLTATPASTSQINLAWTDNATDETAYRVYRSTNGTTYVQVGTDLAAGATSYNDTTPDDGVKYYYKVAAVNTVGETLSDAATANTLTLSISAYWKLDEVSAGSAPVTRNDSVGTAHLTDVNTTPSAAAVISNGMAPTLANSEYLYVADSAAVSTGDIDFTWAFWVYIIADVANAGVSIIGKDQDASTCDYVIDLSFKRFRFFINNAAKLVSDAVDRANNTWYFVVAWHDAAGDTINLQVNNAAARQTATAGVAPADTAAALCIGRRERSGSNGYFTGIVDEVGFWKRVLTADEKTALYNGGAGFTYPF